MISYRTLLFGAIAVVAAAAPAAPALADSGLPQPLAIGVRAPHTGLTQHQTAPVSNAGATSFTNTFVGAIIQFEDLLLRISL
ncbi:MAG TPA: hypothetical protein VFH72_08465 [Candidatus Baltobacteraceae bacterium]|jgi:hypothetical protein|nr:hypothetical protein [Candidatus Baltobacteraceae bacterium]